MMHSSKIRILHLVTRMNLGGVAISIDNLLENMDPDRFESLLVTGRCEFPEKEYYDSTARKYPIKRFQVFHKSFTFFDDIRASMQIINTIKSFNPDIVHTHTSKAGVLGRVFTKLFFPRVKLVHTFHGHLLIGYFSPIKLKIVIGIEKILGLLTDQIVAIGTQVRDDLVEVKVAPVGKFNVFFPGLKPIDLQNREIARSVLNLDSKYIYCTFIGRLTQIKRVDRVLEVARIVANKNSKIKFLIVGDGELMAQLQNSVNFEKLPVTFLGWRNEITDILFASDMLLLVSDNEGIPLVLVEAAQVGLPIVTTPAGSVEDIAIHEKNALVTSFDPKDLAMAVLTLADSPLLRESMSAAGKLIASDLFSIQQMVDKHQDLYRRVLNR